MSDRLRAACILIAANQPFDADESCTASSAFEGKRRPTRVLQIVSKIHEEMVMTNCDVEILLVEDNPNDEILALHVFKEHSIDNLVHVVRDGVEALEFVFCTGAYSDRRIEPPKVILLDLKLPLVDGLEVLRQLRADPQTRLIPVVVLTSSSEERDIVESYRLGVNSYIVKPVDYDRFNEVAEEVSHYWLKLNKQPTSVLERRPGATLEV